MTTSDSQNCMIEFPNTHFPPVAVDARELLANVLTLQNSPILFGCRTGICATCLVSAVGNMLSPTETEQEVLSMIAPDHISARLACQIVPTGNLSLTPLKP